jgi:hypothetical protein
MTTAARRAQRIAMVLGGVGLIVVVLIWRATSNDGPVGQVPAPGAPSQPAAQAPAPTPDSAADAAAAAPAEARPFAGEPIANGNALFDQKLLLDSGLPERDAQNVRDRYEAWQIERVAQSERARREGRVQEIDAITRGLEAQFRQDLGEEMYDWALYGAGDFNRIGVQEVEPGSPAAAAGVEVGDMIRRYADQPVYSPVELVALVGRTPGGRRVPLQVERAGQLIDLQIDAGPLGARIGPLRGKPGAR